MVSVQYFGDHVIRNDKVKIEKVQRRMTKIIQGLSHTEYEERLKVLQLCYATVPT